MSHELGRYSSLGASLDMYELEWEFLQYTDSGYAKWCVFLI